MCYAKFSWTILVFLVLFTVVTGSCLEFGHSCWGAHGKRSGNRVALAAKQPSLLVDKLAEQLYNNNNNENSIDDNGNNNSNAKNYNLPLTASALAPPSVEASAAERTRDVNDAKWRQLLRQHRYQLRQMQRQFDASDAAEGWRKLQQALVEAEQRQQQQQLPMGDFFELKK
ncbi:neuropeptide CCHamide-1 isoform X1 [Drosophila novamexicana]|uniref:neuropeptide CCHamide-1 isoform X1 n=1 Tax=Drosophila novamexicana TaxID=47314 RepID=UPI0011E5D76D|nr:neuropeptide CCHamide-1 isoform X1 [Drosophila novamexicana]